PGERGRHDSVLGRHHARLVEEDPLAAEAVGSHLVAPVDLDLRAELGERVDVRVEPPPPDHVAAGRWYGGAADAGEQRPGEQERGPDSAGKLVVDLGRRQVGRVNTNLVGARPLGLGAELRHQAHHRLDVADSRNVRRRHALAVEASVAAYARKLGEDEEFWRVTALLHDFDYEMHPTLDKHPQDGAPILRDEGYPEEVIEGVLSHAEHLGLPRDTPLKKTLFACDELSGFIHACGLVRPDGIETLEPKSVRKKLKQ